MTRLKETKCIRSLRIAQTLLEKGFKLVSLEHAKQSPGKIVFVFKNSQELEDILSQARKE